MDVNLTRRRFLIGAAPTAAIATTIPVWALAESSESFEQKIAGFKPIHDFSFGTAKAPRGKRAIRSIRDLATVFEPYQHGTKTVVINQEAQRYVPFDADEAFVFTPDALELTGTIAIPPDTPGTTEAVIVDALNRSRTAKIAGADRLLPGQVVSLGRDQPQNAYRTYSMMIGSKGAPAPGATATLSIDLDSPITAQSNVTLTATAAPGDGVAEMVRALVAMINAQRLLMQLGITAVTMPGSPEVYLLNVPALDSPNGPAFGPTARGSTSYARPKPSAAGVGHEYRQMITLCLILAIDGDSVTFSQPLIAPKGATLIASPARLLMREDRGTSSRARITFADTRGITIGQLASFYDNTPDHRHVIAKTDKTVTFDAATPLKIGVFAAFHPVIAATTSAANEDEEDQLLIDRAPEAIRPGHRILLRKELNQAPELQVKAVDRTSIPNIITMTGRRRVGAGTEVLFYPQIRSAQIWSKFNIMPEADHQTVAMELICRAPDAGAIGAWPAFWLFTDGDDPHPGPVKMKASEIDMVEIFNYWSNPSYNCYRPGIPSNSDRVTYTDPRFKDYLPGNDAGSRDRAIQLIWTPDTASFYLDGTLMATCNMTWKTFKRAQIGINLAIGSFHQGFVANGFFPLDFAQFPMRFRIKRLRVLGSV